MAQQQLQPAAGQQPGPGVAARRAGSTQAHAPELSIPTVTVCDTLGQLTPFVVRFPDVPAMANIHPNMAQGPQGVFVFPEYPEPVAQINLAPANLGGGPGQDTATPYNFISQ